MHIQTHIQKWKQFDAARARLDPRQDFELWYWAISSAGCSLINAALHKHGITEENRWFATQIPDVYAVADAHGGWHHAIGQRCDLIHAGIPKVHAPLPAPLEQAFAAMEEIERYRNPCIRSDLPVSDEMLRSFAQAYETVLAVSRDMLGELPQ